VGLLMLIIVMEALQFPPEVMTTGIAVILGVDRVLDMCRTTCNVTGDAMVATLIASSEGDLLSESEVADRLATKRARGFDEHPPSENPASIHR
jgi:proton glutamate symport protein